MAGLITIEDVLEQIVGDIEDEYDFDEEEDNVNFGKGCVDRLVSSIGDEIMLPLIG